MAGKDVKKADADDALPEMTSEQAGIAISAAAMREPQLAALRDKLIAAIEKSEGGLEQFARVIRAKLHEQ